MKTPRTTCIFLVETPMPGGLPPTRHYTSGSTLANKGQAERFVGHVEGPYNSGTFTISALIEMGASGSSGMSWHPAEPMTEEEVRRVFVAEVTSHMRPDDPEPGVCLGGFAPDPDNPAATEASERKQAEGCRAGEVAKAGEEDR